MKKIINNKRIYNPIINPLISVIIPSYNRYTYLVNAVESVLNQSYKNCEIIIINDGSTDKNYIDLDFGNQVKIVNLEINQKQLLGFGPGNIRNFGTDLANGDILAFLDDDDLWVSDKLENQLEQMAQNNVGMSSTEAFFCEGGINTEIEYPLYNGEHYLEDIKFLYKKSNYIKNNKLPKIWDYDFTTIHNCFITSSVVVEKKLFDILGGFRGLPMWADYDCWQGLQQITDSVYIDTPLVYYDSQHGDGRNYSK